MLSSAMIVIGAATTDTIELAMTSSYSASRRSAVSTLESLRPSGILRRLRITAATTTGPASGPRPASSTPVTRLAPLRTARFSNRSVGGGRGVESAFGTIGAASRFNLLMQAYAEFTRFPYDLRDFERNMTV